MNCDTRQTADSGQSAGRPAPAAGEKRADASVIAGSITVAGDLRGTGAVLVEGTVLGGIRLDRAVTVAGSGVVRGPIRADVVCVSGCVEGEITARTALRLEMTGSITGDVTTRSFTIQDGGYFNGLSHMTETGAEPVIVYQPPEEGESGGGESP